MDLIPEQHPVWTFHPQTFWVQEQGGGDEPSSEIESIVNQFTCTANALYRKFETNISGHETVRPRSQFLHSVSDLYIPTISPQTQYNKTAWRIGLGNI